MGESLVPPLPLRSAQVDLDAFLLHAAGVWRETDGRTLCIAFQEGSAVAARFIFDRRWRLYREWRPQFGWIADVKVQCGSTVLKPK